MSAIQWFDSALLAIGRGEIDLASDALKLGLVTGVVMAEDDATPAWGPAGATNLASAEVAAGASYAGPVTLTGVDWSIDEGRVALTAERVRIGPDRAGAQNVEAFVIFDDSHPDKLALAWGEVEHSLRNGALILDLPLLLAMESVEAGVLRRYPTLLSAPSSQYAVISQSQPALKTPVQFGDLDTAVVRITNASMAHHYATWAAFNADQSMVLLWGSSGGTILNVADWSVVRAGFDPGFVGCFFDPVDPDLIWGHDGHGGGNGIYRYSVAENDDERIALTGYSGVSIGMGEGSISSDGRYLVLCGLKTADTTPYVLVFDTSTDTVTATLTLTGWTYNNNTGLDNAHISPSGDYVVVASMYAGNRGHRIYDRATLTYQRAYTGGSGTNASTGFAGHMDMGYRVNGDEVMLRQRTDGAIVTVRLSDLNEQVEQSASAASWAWHGSCRNIHRPGYAYVSMLYQSDQSSKYLYREVCALKLDGSGSLERFGQAMFPTSADYDLQAKATASPHGDMVLMTSGWGTTTPREYVMYVPETMPEPEPELVLGLDFTDPTALPVSAVSFGRVGTATVVDFEASKTAISNELRFPGLRRVENLLFGPDPIFPTNRTSSEGDLSTYYLKTYSEEAAPFGGFADAVEIDGSGNIRQLTKRTQNDTGVRYVVSYFVNMGDGDAPVLGGSGVGDFAVQLQNQTNQTVLSAGLVDIGDGVYRAYGSRTSPSTALLNAGVYRFADQSSDTMRVTGMQYEVVPDGVTTPSEYVSHQIQPGPKFHGAFADGVAYFGTDRSGDPLGGSVRGAQIGTGDALAMTLDWYTPAAGKLEVDFDLDTVGGDEYGVLLLDDGSDENRVRLWADGEAGEIKGQRTVWSESEPPQGVAASLSAMVTVVLEWTASTLTLTVGENTVSLGAGMPPHFIRALIGQDGVNWLAGCVKEIRAYGIPNGDGPSPKVAPVPPPTPRTNTRWVDLTNGSDEADGLTKETAWNTLSGKASSVPADCTVMFVDGEHEVSEYVYKTWAYSQRLPAGVTLRGETFRGCRIFNPSSEQTGDTGLAFILVGDSNDGEVDVEIYGFDIEVPANQAAPILIDGDCDGVRVIGNKIKPTYLEWHTHSVYISSGTSYATAPRNGVIAHNEIIMSDLQGSGIHWFAGEGEDNGRSGGHDWDIEYNRITGAARQGAMFAPTRQTEYPVNVSFWHNVIDGAWAEGALVFSEFKRDSRSGMDETFDCRFNRLRNSANDTLLAIATLNDPPSVEHAPTLAFNRYLVSDWTRLPNLRQQAYAAGDSVEPA